MANLHTDEGLEDEWLEVGRIVAPQGLDGSVRVYPNSDFPERFLEPGERWISKSGQLEPEPIQLLSGRYLEGKGLYIIKIAGLTNRDQAETLRAAKLLVPSSDRLPIEADEFHVADLIGLEARLAGTGALIGTVVEVYSAGNDLLAIQLNDDHGSDPDQPERGSNSGKTPKKRASGQKVPVLVPFVHAIVPVVNLDAGYVEIDPPKGLLPDQ